MNERNSMSDHNSTSINTGGGSFTAVGSAIGGSGHRLEGTISGVTIDAGAPAGPVSRDDLLAVLAQIRDHLARADDLPEQARAELEEDAQAAVNAVNRPEPNLKRATERLGSMQRLLDAAGSAVASAVGLGKLVASAVKLVSQIAL